MSRAGVNEDLAADGMVTIQTESGRQTQGYLASSPTADYNVKAYGAKGNGVTVTDASIINGQATLSSVTAKFSSDDIGKRVMVVGAGVAAQGGVLSATITSASNGFVGLSASASTTVSGAEVTYGTEDTAALLAAIAAIPATGGVLYAPRGIYLSDTLTIKSFLEIRGDGKGRTIFAPFCNGHEFITHPASWSTTPGQDVTLRSLKIDCSGMWGSGGYTSQIKPVNMSYTQRGQCIDVWVHNSPASAIAFDFALDACLIEDCLVTNAGRMNDGTQPGGSGFGIGTLGTSNEEPITITNCWAIGCKRYGIFLEAQAGGLATATSGARIIGNYCRGNQNGIGDSGSRRSIIIGNTCTANTSNGIAIDGGTYAPGFPGQEFLVTDNACYANGGDGIRYDGTDAQSGWKGSIYGNLCSFNTGRGIAFWLDTNSVAGMKLNDNVCYQNGKSGIRVMYNGATNTAGMATSEICDNMVWNNGTTASSGDKDGIRIEVPCTDVRIVNNRCFDRQGVKTQDYGLILSSGTAYSGGSITGNDLRGNLTGGANLSTAVSTSTHIGSNDGMTHAAPVSVSVGASPATLTAPTPGTYYFSGGTVTGLTLVGVTLDNATKTIRVEGSDAVVVTHSGAPTVVFRPGS